MNPNESRPWLEKAKELRDLGMTYVDIGKRVGKGETTVRSAILGIKRGPREYLGVCPSRPPERPKVRPKPKIVPREVINAATLAFAKGEIDRAELVRRITP